ncbi:MAG TPA: hypothetical protein ENN99_02990 [Chloroflexi bacterium]|nr:hypothetical protein [Chloroflexota bacterium]
MATTLSLNEFSRYITDQIERIGAMRREVEEIQVGFNSAYVEWKAQHDATLERLTETMVERWDELGPDLQTRIEAHIPQERETAAQRREELRETLIPETQAEADLVLQEGQALTHKLRQLNPKLDRREEELKAQARTLEEELKQLNAQIKQLSGCLTVMFNFFRINKLDRQRQQVIGQLKVVQQELKKVREEWKEAQQEISAEQTALQTDWQELTLKLAQLQAELDYLDVETNRESLAFKRATRHMVDNLKEHVPCPADDIKTDLDHMVELNIQTDTYQDGLGSVGSLLSLLDGITEGLKRFDESVQGLIKEQSMHSAYLPKLRITVPDDVAAFHGQWDGLAQQVRDDGRLCAQPTEFLDIVRPVIQRELSETQIKGMFESMGQALDKATRGWKG